jgi:hypothetical protein
MVSMLDSSVPRISVAKLTCALMAVAVAHMAYTFFLYRARVLTHSSTASSDFVLFALPAILAFIGYLFLLRARAIRKIRAWVAAFFLTVFSFWFSLYLAFNTYGT